MTSEATDALLAQIYAAPGDLGLRSIYADALQAAGDPRGELIALQLAGADEHRVAALLDQHWRSWLGPIARCTSRRDIELRDGFLAHVTIRQPAEMTRLEWHRIHRAAEWATVHSLHIHPDALATASRENLGALLSYAPLATLRLLDLPASVLRTVRGRHLALDTITVTAHDEALALDPDIIRGARLVCRRLRWHSGSPADANLWSLAIEADVPSLAIESPYFHYTMMSELVGALARGHMRPHDLRYRFPDCHLAIGRHTLSIDMVPSPEPPDREVAIESLRFLEAVLVDFEHITLATTDLDGHRTVLFDGAAPAALAWLADHPALPSPPDDDDDDDDDD